MQSAARTLGLRLLVFNVMPDTEITPVFSTLIEHRAGAILVGVGMTSVPSEMKFCRMRFALCYPRCFPTAVTRGKGRF